MTEQLHYTIYKISNTIDDKIYIGSTRLILRKRMYVHKSCARGDKEQRPIAQHMRQLGIKNFSISAIRKVIVSCRKDARIEEQKELEKYENEQLLNVPRAYSENHDKTRDIIKKRANRRAYYARHKSNPEWMKKNREKCRIRMRKKRENLKYLRELPFYEGKL